jgi:hypothetical protein
MCKYTTNRPFHIHISVKLSDKTTLPIPPGAIIRKKITIFADNKLPLTEHGTAQETNDDDDRGRAEKHAR